VGPRARLPRRSAIVDRTPDRLDQPRFIRATRRSRDERLPSPLARRPRMRAPPRFSSDLRLCKNVGTPCELAERLCFFAFPPCAFVFPPLARRAARRAAIAEKRQATSEMGHPLSEVPTRFSSLPTRRDARTPVPAVKLRRRDALEALRGRLRAKKEEMGARIAALRARIVALRLRTPAVPVPAASARSWYLCGAAPPDRPSMDGMNKRPLSYRSRSS
jgi:hypothetical protein